MEPKDIEGLKERSVAGSEVELPGRQLCLEDERAHPDKIWWARQFSNKDNVRAHHVTAREILEQTDGKVDVFVQSIGTGGSLVGIAEILKKEIPNVKVIGIQPASSKELWHPGMDFPVTETKGGIVSAMLKQKGLIDVLVRITDAEARAMTHQIVAGGGPVLRRLFRGQRSFCPGRSQESRWQEDRRHPSLRPHEQVLDRRTVCYLIVEGFALTAAPPSGPRLLALSGVPRTGSSPEGVES